MPDNTNGGIAAISKHRVYVNNGFDVLKNLFRLGVCSGFCPGEGLS